MSKSNRTSTGSSAKARLRKAIAKVQPQITRVEPLESRLLFSTFVVSTSADSGTGSLRDAITQANATPGADTIQFNLATGQTRIALSSALPAITDAVTIDGTSEPGFAGKPMVELNGAAAGNVSGLVIHASDVTVKGLVINRFAVDGIDLSNPAATADVSNITISGNYIGTDTSGEFALANGAAGINLSIGTTYNVLNAVVSGNVIAASGGAGLFLNNSQGGLFTGNIIGLDASGTKAVDSSGVSFGNRGDGVAFDGLSLNNTLGGTTAADRNIISNNGSSGGVVMNTSGAQANLIVGNYIGTDITGTVAFGNLSDGFYGGSAGATVSGNVISGNGNTGVDLGDDTTIINNFIGTDASGTQPLGNAYDGVYIVGTGNTIGLPGQGNIIAYNGAAGPGAGNGVTIVIWFSTGNSVRGNAIYGNSGLGIDLGADGVTPNSDLPADHQGPNNLQNYPVLSSATVSNSSVTISGSLSANASTVYTLDFYATDVADPSGHGQARTYLGSVQVTTDASGKASFTQVFGGVPSGQLVFTATATDPEGNTSEFALNALAPAPALALNTTTSLTLNGSSFGFGQTVCANVAVVDSGGNPVSGVVQLMDGQTLLANLTLDSTGHATFTDSALAMGSHTLNAIFMASSAFNGSSASAPITVNPDPTSTALSATGGTFFGQAMMLTATVAPMDAGATFSGGIVNFFDGQVFLGSSALSASDVATLSVQLSAGTHSLTAVYAGNSGFASSTSAAVTGIVNLESTATALSSSGASVFGQGITFNAAVTFADAETVSPTGTVTFMDGSVVIGTAALDASGHAMVSLVLGVGTHSVTAIYTGNVNFASSTSSAVAQVVSAEPTALTLGATGGSLFGQTVVFNSTLTHPDAETIAPTGTLTFFDGSAVLGSASFDATGHASFSLAGLSVGSHTITVSYAGDGNYAGSSSATTLNVAKDGASITLSSSGASTFDQAVTFTAIVTPADAALTPTGTVTFMDGSSVLGTAALDGSGHASFSTSALMAGTHSVTAVYNGDVDFAGSTSAAFSQWVAKAGTQTGLTTSSATTLQGQSVTFTATVSNPNATGTVTFYDGSTALGTTAVSGGKAVLTTSGLPAGSHYLNAVYSGDANFNDSGSPLITQTVMPAAPSASNTALSSSNSSPMLGQAVTFTATVTSAKGITPTGAVTFKDGATVLGSAALVNGVATFTTSSLSLGGHSITASYGGDAVDLASVSSALSLFVNAPPTGSVSSGQTSANNFWSRANGMTLLLNFNGSFTSTALGNWMAATFPNLFGAHSQYFNLSGASNLQVMIDYQVAGLVAPKVLVNMFTLALDMYATSSSLGGSTAAAYGFDVSSVGLAGATWNVGNQGAPFGFANNSTHTVLELLQAANNRSPNGNLFMGSTPQSNQANAVFNSLLAAGK